MNQEHRTYYVFKNGEKLGPFTLHEIRSMLAQKTIAEMDVVWREGWRFCKLVKWLPNVMASSRHPLLNVRIKKLPVLWYRRAWVRAILAWIKRQ